jgi:DNA primase
LAGRIRQEDLEAVRERTDLVQVVGQYLTLKKSGHDSMSGLCPFHQEKTPSFHVRPSKQLYHCFGCGAGGDAIRFVREIEHLSFTEAVERLAQQAGIQLRYEGDSPQERREAARRQAIFKANGSAADLFSKMLLQGREAQGAREYLSERGISADAIQAFQIGFAPGYPDFLLRRLAKESDPQMLIEAGLASRTDDGQVRDRFRGRITFPIQDLQGRVVGFGGRVVPTDPRAEKLAKYINTAETAVYRKNELLYNFHRARGAISRSGEAIVVEGYTDVIGPVMAGVENVVATCGTALGEEHFRLLSRFAQRAVLAFDSDEAGARAAERAFSFHEKYPIQSVVMVLPDGLDPAEFVAQRGPDAVREAAQRALPLVEYMIRRTVSRHDVSTIEGQSAAVADALAILQDLQDPVRRSGYGHLLADLSGISDASVMASLEKRLSGRPQEVAKTVRKGSARERVEREMLKLMAQSADGSRDVIDRLSEDHFQSDRHRALFRALMTSSAAELAAGDDDRLAAAVSALAVEPLEGEATIEYAEQVWARLEEFVLKDRSERMRVRLQKMNPISDDGYEQLFQELVVVDGELRRLRQGVRDPA